mmetsp:Transcript_47870/g.154367  ORF Transcript_47870/g.154367 Transcript_47870/m.154367 type:complete len:381 (+) Transcript_47870:1398-2540(+)
MAAGVVWQPQRGVVQAHLRASAWSLRSRLGARGGARRRCHGAVGLPGSGSGHRAVRTAELRGTSFPLRIFCTDCLGRCPGPPPRARLLSRPGPRPTFRSSARRFLACARSRTFAALRRRSAGRCRRAGHGAGAGGIGGASGGLVRARCGHREYERTGDALHLARVGRPRWLVLVLLLAAALTAEGAGPRRLIAVSAAGRGLARCRREVQGIGIAGCLAAGLRRRRLGFDRRGPGLGAALGVALGGDSHRRVAKRGRRIAAGAVAAAVVQSDGVPGGGALALCIFGGRQCGSASRSTWQGPWTWGGRLWARRFRPAAGRPAPRRPGSRLPCRRRHRRGARGAAVGSGGDRHHGVDGPTAGRGADAATAGSSRGMVATAQGE